MNPAAAAFRARLEGAMIPAVPAPFNDEGLRAVDADNALAAHMAASAVPGVAVWAHTGRGLALTHVERRELIKRWRAGLRADQFLIAGAGCPAPAEGSADDLTDAEYITRAAGMARDAGKFGADAVLVYAPTRFRGRPDQDRLVLQYHAAIAEVGLPMILFYLYESAGGVSYGQPLIAELLKMEMVAGIKIATLDSVMTFQDISRLARAVAPEVAVLTGEDRFLGYSVMRGATGALIGMASVLPDLHCELLKFWRAGQYDRFLKRSIALDNFAESTFVQPMEGYIRRLLLALALDGVIAQEAAYDPWGPPIRHAELVAIGEALKFLKKS